ncbi:MULTISPECIES: hypothetical protein [Pseudomonas]|jgi:hypothetical protein|uniref:Uncharacterized protein n=3 Tax=Pseudomonas TaxID=286 RepID=A0A7X1WRH3_9PSED|nr:MULTISPECIES: hypothetical protein [Pseudomonas]MBC2692595.1 hypothetical protein [Pseudomonas kielensis]MDD1009331.1 hypothetical protein [Pseudomonas shahriarae]MQT73294.1 hypothetical protein [Pseudomonas helleri]MQT89686.1 hypothetical protein [Pseudomonas helleri]MQU03738.1 hypothetical protein [Pseudomonas sp. FSL R10-2245]
MASKPELTDRDHDNMDAFLGYVLDAHKAGDITKQEAVADLAHVMTALDQRSYDEVRSWFEKGRKHLADAN